MYTAKATADWPAPNYVNPPNRIPVLVASEIPLAILMTLAVCARFYSRAVLRRILSWDDWLILPAWACLMTVTIVSMYTCIHLNMTRHIWDVKPEWASLALRINLTYEIMYPLGVALTKVSICLNYLRIFPLQTFNDVFCKSMVVYTVCWLLSTVIPQIDQFVHCPPGNPAQDRIRVNTGCINQKAFLISTAALNSLSDLAIFHWPAWFIWGMHVPTDQRLGLIGLFCVGIVICVAGVLRMWFFSVWFKSVDPYWDGVWNYVILAAETNIGVICACLPCCKPLLVRLLPCVFSNSESRSSRRSKNNQNNHNDNNSPLDGGGGYRGIGGVVGRGDVPKPMGRKNRSKSWSLFGTGTTLTTAGTGTATDASFSPVDKEPASDTLILMDDLGRIITPSGDGSSLAGTTNYDGITPQRSAAASHVDLEAAARGDEVRRLAERRLL